MISFFNDPAHEECDRGDCDRREALSEPCAVGQLMAAVLARYGIAANVDSVLPRLPELEHQRTRSGVLLSVG